MSEGRFKSRHHYERSEQNRRYFHSVIRTYLKFSEYAPVVAFDYDPQASVKKLTPDVVHFLCDVELATMKVLKTPELFEHWKALIEDEKISPSVATSIVNRCARIYRKKGLAPYSYFGALRQPVGSAAA